MENPNKGKKIDIKNIEYLSFEGGVAKGFVYLGAIWALEEKIRGKAGIPIIDHLRQPLPEDRQIKGISGASAGTITAFMIAIGMSSKDIQNELKRKTNDKTSIGTEEFSGILEDIADVAEYVFPIPRFTNKTEVGVFQNFFETMDDIVVDKQRVVMDSQEAINKKETRVKTVIAKRGIRPALFNLLNDIVQLTPLIDEEIKKTFVYKKIFETPNEIGLTNTANYFQSLFAHRGLFSGLNVREYFIDVLQRQWLKRLSVLPNPLRANYSRIDGGVKNMSFAEFYNIFGVDLVITGTNISQNEPKYFSLHHTPDFPVVEAVAISMNVPIVFKPVYIDFSVHRFIDNPKEYSKEYKGLWGDGGMLNNYPLHAFDKIEKFQYRVFDHLIKDDNYSEAEVGANTPASSAPFNKKVLGFRLTKFSRYNKKINEQEIFDTEKYLKLPTFIGDLLGTFMYSGNDGQVRSEKEEDNTIYLNTDNVNAWDFSPIRSEFNLEKEINPPPFQDFSNQLSRQFKVPIEARILDAHKAVQDVLFNVPLK